MASSAASVRPRPDVPPPFGRILCGVDGSRSDHLAIEQAIALSGPSTALVFLCARSAGGAGATRQATISAERADRSLEHAVQAASEAGIDAAAEIVAGHDPRRSLLDEPSRSDC